MKLEIALSVLIGSIVVGCSNDTQAASRSKSGVIRTPYGILQYTSNTMARTPSFAVRDQSLICIGLSITPDAEIRLKNGGEVVSGEGFKRMLYSISELTGELARQRGISNIVEIDGRKNNRVVALPDPLAYDPCRVNSDNVLLLTAIKVADHALGYEVDVTIQQSQNITSYRLLRSAHRPYQGNAYIPLETGSTPDGIPIYEVYRDVQLVNSTALSTNIGVQKHER